MHENYLGFSKPATFWSLGERYKHTLTGDQIDQCLRFFTYANSKYLLKAYTYLRQAYTYTYRIISYNNIYRLENLMWIFRSMWNSIIYQLNSIVQVWTEIFRHKLKDTHTPHTHTHTWTQCLYYLSFFQRRRYNWSYPCHDWRRWEKETISRKQYISKHDAYNCLNCYLRVISFQMYIISNAYI